MRVTQEYHDALVSNRDAAYAELDQAREENEHKLAAIETLQRELDDARIALYEANEDRQPSDMADDIVEVFSKALTEWLTFYNFEANGIDFSDVLRPALLTDLHFYLRHTARDVDEVLDHWGVDKDEEVIPLAGLQSLADALERLSASETAVAFPEADQS